MNRSNLRQIQHFIGGGHTAGERKHQIQPLDRRGSGRGCSAPAQNSKAVWRSRAAGLGGDHPQADARCCFR